MLIILLVIAAIVALILIVGLVKRKDYLIQREVIINAPVQVVFAYIRQLKNQDNFNKWVMADPNMQRIFKGTDGTEGFIYGWNGNKQAGEGEQEITKIAEGKSVTTEIRFVRPFTSVAQAVMTTEAVGTGQTKVRWSNASTMKYPMNVMLGPITNMLAKDMDTSLGNLKRTLER